MINIKPLLDRFCRYVRIDTQANANSTTYPSSPGQLELGRLLVFELQEMGITDAEQDRHGLVYATIPATKGCGDKTIIAFSAHMDTAPDAPGTNVCPIVHENYDGKDIKLSEDTSKCILVNESPELRDLIGKTIITSDGTTLLGSDDKSGVAVIMETAARLMNNSTIEHGPIRLLFTCDEEIGHGVDFVDLNRLGASVAYTFDGGGSGDIDVETFSADLATITIKGVNIHPSIGKNRMVNAVRIAEAFLQALPKDGVSPETTEARQGFFHPCFIEGGVDTCTVKLLIRDFDNDNLAEKNQLLSEIVATLRQSYPKASIDLSCTPQYRNMLGGLLKEPRAVAYAEEAMKRVGIVPRRTIVRGGTDGSRLTALGLPTPNLSTGEHNLHSVLEWTCLEEMDVAVRTAIELAKVWAEN